MKVKVKVKMKVKVKEKTMIGACTTLELVSGHPGPPILLMQVISKSMIVIKGEDHCTGNTKTQRFLGS